jgi:hypothetical protein
MKGKPASQYPNRVPWHNDFRYVSCWNTSSANKEDAYIESQPATGIKKHDLRKTSFTLPVLTQKKIWIIWIPVMLPWMLVYDHINASYRYDRDPSRISSCARTCHDLCKNGYLVWPPLWSSGQSSWLQIQRFQIRFPGLPDFLRSSRSGTGSTQPREGNWGATWM